MPAPTLTDKNSSFSLTLYNSQQAQDNRNAGLNVTAPTFQDSDATILTALEQQGRATISGVATAPRLSRQAAFSADPRTALAEWYAKLLAVVNGRQGSGYTIDVPSKNTTYDGLVQTAAATVRGGEFLQVDWDIEFVRGVAVDVQSDPSPVSVSPGEYRIASTVPDAITEWQVEDSQGVETYRRTFAENGGDNDLGSSVGATRRIRVIGQVDGTVAERNQFDADITDTLGQDTLITLRDALTGRTFEGMLDSYDATDESGLTRLNEYAIEFVEGTN